MSADDKFLWLCILGTEAGFLITCLFLINLAYAYGKSLQELQQRPPPETQDP